MRFFGQSGLEYGRKRSASRLRQTFQPRNTRTTRNKTSRPNDPISCVWCISWFPPRWCNRCALPPQSKKFPAGATRGGLGHRRARSGLYLVTHLKIFHELFGSGIRLPQDAAQCSLIHFPVHGHDAHIAAAPHDEMASLLPLPHKAQVFQCLGNSRAGDAREFRHVRPRRWSGLRRGGRANLFPPETTRWLP